MTKEWNAARESSGGASLIARVYLPTFWLYLAYRGCCWVRNTFICIMLTGPFDKTGKKDHEPHASTDSDNDSEKGKSEKTKKPSI